MEVDFEMKICSRCIYDERVSGITFDHFGVCNYCKQVDALAKEYGTGQDYGKKAFEKIVSDVRKQGKGKKYDCIVGVSGGTDSSYLLYLAKQYGLKPLAVHYDNTWNTAAATMNIYRVLKGLDVDLHTCVISNIEADDIFRSFFLAGVPEIEASTDLGYAYLLRKAARKFGVKYIFEGHSFIEEGITPLGKNYFDGRYIQSIHKRYGNVPLKTYPLMTFERFVYSILFTQVKFIRPLWYLDYSKHSAKKFLSENYGWEDYGGHHLENRMTAFYHSVYLPRKFNTDMRNNTLSAQVRNGNLKREDALDLYNSDPLVEPALINYFISRLGLSVQDFERIMSEPPRSWKEFPTYKTRFERNRWLFSLFAKANLVPKSFYLKYCFKDSDSQ